MKLSVWQQFSSNHSSRFEMVGVFRTAEDAAKAGQTLLDMLREINDWYVANVSGRADIDLHPSPVERALAERFGIKWNDYTLGEWLGFDPEGRGPVQIVNNLVIVDGWESDTGAKPLDDIVRRLGGNAFVDGTLEHIDLAPGAEFPILLEIRPEVSFTLTCRFTSPADAEALLKAITLGYEDAPRGEPFKLHTGTSEITIEEIEYNPTILSLKRARMRPLYGGFRRLLGFLTERGVSQFKCEFFETRSALTMIDQGRNS